jgi:hypothetical protein
MSKSTDIFSGFCTIRRQIFALVSVLSVLLLGLELAASPVPAVGTDSGAPVVAPRTDNPQVSRSAFATVFRVLTHPRCKNCHPAGDRPLRGDKSVPHGMNIQRRLAEVGLACSTCHQSENTPGRRQPPGAPHWNLAPRAQAFEGRSAAQLCAQIKEPTSNGQRTLQKLFEHIRADPLVLWGWNPGEGRKLVSVSHDAFVRAFQTWINGGAHCPQESKP